jgi:23S rRNA pseudouridine2605 synthase
MEERLQKLMAQSGLGSRRACEEMIAAGRVTVNGRTAVLGEKADPQRDRILVDGRPLRVAEEAVYIALYKPRGVISAVSGPDPRPTVRNLVDVPGHLYPVGRLDLDSEGLILLTNDGDLANRLTHPRYEHEKEYRVLVASRPDEEQLQTWRRGVVLEDGYRTQPADVRFEQPFGKGAWLRIILREGRKRQIRETGAQIGLPVVKIIRVRIGSLMLGGLKPGEWRQLSPDEVRLLKDPSAASAVRAARPARVVRSTRRRGASSGEPQAGSGRPRRSNRAQRPDHDQPDRTRAGRTRPGSRERTGDVSSDRPPTGRERAGAKPSRGTPAGRTPSGRPAARRPGRASGPSRPPKPGRPTRKKPSS